MCFILCVVDRTVLAWFENGVGYDTHKQIWMHEPTDFRICQNVFHKQKFMNKRTLKNPLFKGLHLQSEDFEPVYILLNNLIVCVYYINKSFCPSKYSNFNLIIFKCLWHTDRMSKEH